MATLTLKQNATPAYRRVRPVPYEFLPIVEQELERLLCLGVIKPVRHADWVAPVMVVKKPNGSARLCVNYSTGLNDALQLHQHPLPVPEDILATLNGGHVFSRTVFSDACLQVEIDDDSKPLCNINTNRGVYEYQRLPFGVKSAPGIFQAIMDKMLTGLPFVTAYLDDIVVVSRSQDDHGRHLHAVFDRINAHGIRVRPGKVLNLPAINKVLWIHRRQRWTPLGPSKDHRCSRHAGTYQHHQSPLFPWASQLLPVLCP